MNAYRTLTAVTLALTAFAAQADSALPRDGDWNSYPLATTSSTLTREAVVAELVAARQSGTLPQDAEWYNVPAPLNIPGTALSRAEVREGAVAAAKGARTAPSAE
jgi:hypothetical protein